MNLNEALTAYRQAILEQAAGDLLAKVCCLPQANSMMAFTARDAVLRLATPDSLTAALMETRFLADATPPKPATDYTIDNMVAAQGRRHNYSRGR